MLFTILKNNLLQKIKIATVSD